VPGKLLSMGVFEVGLLFKSHLLQLESKIGKKKQEKEYEEKIKRRLDFSGLLMYNLNGSKRNLRFAPVR